jgi:hypothetical protein
LQREHDVALGRSYAGRQPDRKEAIVIRRTATDLAYLVLLLTL